MVIGIVKSLWVVWIISHLVKCYLHWYIASRNNISLNAGGGLPIETLWYITKPVAKEYEKLKKASNYMQTANMILLLFIIVLSIIIK